MEKVHDDGCSVFYFDFASRSRVQFDAMRELPPELSQIPPFTLKCHLAGGALLKSVFTLVTLVMF